MSMSIQANMTAMSATAASTLTNQGAEGIEGGERPPAPPPGGPKGPPPVGADALSQVIEGLDDDTQSELLAAVDEMRSSGASFDEVRSYVNETLEANGIEPPEPPEPPVGAGYAGDEAGVEPGYFVNTLA